MQRTTRSNKLRPANKIYKLSFDELEPEQTNKKVLDIQFLEDVEVELKVELGTTTMNARDVLTLKTGSIIELDRVAGENVDILLNEEYFAKGEVVVLDESYGVRITSINKE